MISIQKRLLTSLLIGLPLLWVLTSVVVAWRLLHEINEINDAQITQVARYLLGVVSDEDLEGEYETRHAQYATEGNHESKEKYDDESDDDDKKNDDDDDDDDNATRTYSQNHDAVPTDVPTDVATKVFHLDTQDTVNFDASPLAKAKNEHMGFAIWDKAGRLLLADDNGLNFDYLPNQQGFVEEAHPAYQHLNPDSQQWRLFYVQDNGAGTHTQRVIAVGQDLQSRHNMVFEALMVQLLPMLVGLMAFMLLVIWSVRRGFAPLNELSESLAKRDPNDNTPIQSQVPQTLIPKEILPLVEALNALFVNVSSTLAREQRFTADASHELRSPLASLQLQADLLQQRLLEIGLIHDDDNDDNPLYTRSQNISAGIARANHLVEQLLIMATLAPNHPLPAQQQIHVDWLKLTDEVLSEVNPDAREKNIQLRRVLRCPANDVLPIAVNPTLFKLLLRNVLDNAIRYCPNHSEVTLELAQNHLRIIDTGEGVPTDNLPHLTQRFYRPAGQVQRGSGLGLSIAHRIANLHGLELRLSNQVPPKHGLIVELSRP